MFWEPFSLIFPVQNEEIFGKKSIQTLHKGVILIKPSQVQMMELLIAQFLGWIQLFPNNRIKSSKYIFIFLNIHQD